MIPALAHTLFRFVIKIYNGENFAIIKNLASHSRECVLWGFCDSLE